MEQMSHTVSRDGYRRKGNQRVRYSRTDREMIDLMHEELPKVAKKMKKTLVGHYERVDNPDGSFTATIRVR